MTKLIQLFVITVIVVISELDLIKANAPCVCTRELNPVCGSDHVTYGNPCEFACAQKKKDIKMSYMGHCKAQKRLDVEESDSCFCTKEFRPVCGSDLNTYSNHCELKCAQRKRTDLTMVNKGACPGDESHLIL